MNIKKGWQEKFFAELAKTGNVAGACRRADISQAHVYALRKENEDFRKRWENALETAIDALEAVAIRRAKASSDTLLIFLLKAHRPEKYRDNYKVELSGNVNLNHYENASQVFDSLISEDTPTSPAPKVPE